MVFDSREKAHEHILKLRHGPEVNGYVSADASPIHEFCLLQCKVVGSGRLAAGGSKQEQVAMCNLFKAMGL
jgi:hypothetical protein